MPDSYLCVRFVDAGDSTGELIVRAGAHGFSGVGRAYFHIREFEEFAVAIATFPFSNHTRPRIAGGYFISNHGNSVLDQEHVFITAYPIDSKGHLGIQIGMAMHRQVGDRPEKQASARIEILSAYETLAHFSRELLAVLRGNRDEAVLIGE